ncbi:MAG: polysaccharide pyruvyl transferase family protein [Verrucomicrobiota bacterium]
MPHTATTITRRNALAQIGLAALTTSSLHAASDQPKHILLRSSWQTVNIGDIAHTPGVLHLLEEHLPEVKVTLWPSHVNNGVEEMLRARFPKLEIAKDTPALQRAFKQCDFLLHGSGPSLVAERDVIKWSERTNNKPYGVFGITVSPKGSASTKNTGETKLAKTIKVLSQAQFVYFRDSHSLQFAKQQGCTSPVMAFGPDGAFACDLRDDDKAEAFLKNNHLEKGKFLCCIPRLRYTPYWTIPSKKRPIDPVKHQRNEAMKEHDHAQLRQAIIEITRQTQMKVLICPEDQTQMKIGREMLYDQLPEDVKNKTVWRPDYWLTGEAISVYTSSIGLFGNEMHSPIMCIGHDIPAIVCRWVEQTSKGYMWQDISLEQWLFDMDDESQVKQIVPAVLAIAQNPAAAKKIAAKANRYVWQRQKQAMMQLKKSLNAIK